MAKLYEALSDYFTQKGSPSVPNALYAAVGEALGTSVEADVVYPIRDDPITFLVVAGGEATVISFEAPSTTIRFLGSLAGATYTETYRLLEDGPETVECVLEHERLGEAGPIRIEYQPWTERGLAHQEHLAKSRGRTDSDASRHVQALG